MKKDKQLRFEREDDNSCPFIAYNIKITLGPISGSAG
jgi:hypothetical protein